jgi:hypothetical protein
MARTATAATELTSRTHPEIRPNLAATDKPLALQNPKLNWTPLDRAPAREI